MTTSPEFSLILVLWLNMEQPTQEEENEHEKRNAVEGAVSAHTHQRLLRSPGIDSLELIPPSYVACAGILGSAGPVHRLFPKFQH
jgi:hypothetical protein